MTIQRFDPANTGDMLPLAESYGTGEYVRYADHLAAIECLAAWRAAVIDACVVACIEWDEADPRGSLERLIAWREEIALDPKVSERAASLTVLADGGPPCSTHPDAPHGFNRNASHSADRYVCDCEGWKPE